MASKVECDPQSQRRARGSRGRWPRPPKSGSRDGRAPLRSPAARAASPCPMSGAHASASSSGPSIDAIAGYRGGPVTEGRLRRGKRQETSHLHVAPPYARRAPQEENLGDGLRNRRSREERAERRDAGVRLREHRQRSRPAGRRPRRALPGARPRLRAAFPFRPPARQRARSASASTGLARAAVSEESAVSAGAGSMASLGQSKPGPRRDETGSAASAAPRRAVAALSSRVGRVSRPGTTSRRATARTRSLPSFQLAMSSARGAMRAISLGGLRPGGRRRCREERERRAGGLQLVAGRAEHEVAAVEILLEPRQRVGRDVGASLRRAPRPTRRTSSRRRPRLSPASPIGCWRTAAVIRIGARRDQAQAEGAPDAPARGCGSFDAQMIEQRDVIRVYDCQPSPALTRRSRLPGVALVHRDHLKLAGQLAHRVKRREVPEGMLDRMPPGARRSTGCPVP